MRAPHMELSFPLVALLNTCSCNVLIDTEIARQLDDQDLIIGQGGAKQPQIDKVSVDPTIASTSMSTYRLTSAMGPYHYT